MRAVQRLEWRSRLPLGRGVLGDLPRARKGGSGLIPARSGAPILVPSRSIQGVVSGGVLWRGRAAGQLPCGHATTRTEAGSSAAAMPGRPTRECVDGPTTGCNGTKNPARGGGDAALLTTRTAALRCPAAPWIRTTSQRRRCEGKGAVRSPHPRTCLYTFRGRTFTATGS